MAWYHILRHERLERHANGILQVSEVLLNPDPLSESELLWIV